MDIAKLHLLGDKILVKENKGEMVGGFFLMENSKDKPFLGTVIKVGDGKVKNDTFSSPVKEGDKILFQKWNCSEINLNNHKYMCVKFDDILGIVHD